MAKAVNVHEAKTHFSELLKRVARGEEVVIAKAGHPVARLVPLAATAITRRPGTARGKVTIMPDFDAPMPDDLRRAFDR
ncbi:MAG TPA: type II toxin-antitoxin system Phd/YefM family antitoxin [Candidatus Binataceae bacterium]|nr:type II toxin-antitoxin system Phd/YefM family antitoxin [Candidatus Binataceae bacterium]